MSFISGVRIPAQEIVADTCTGEGIFGWTCSTASSIQGVIRVVAITVAIIFVVYKAVSSKFAIGTIIVSALAAGIFIWIVFNVTALRDQVAPNMPGAAPVMESRQADQSLT